MVPNSVLRFVPVFRSYPWGGDRLAKVLNKQVPGEGIWAESWEVVDHGADQSIVNEGPFSGWTLRQLIESFPDEILGTVASKGAFPLLFKYLDCHQVLSVQVHPNDAYAATMNPPDAGKTEAWYVIDALANSKIYAGLRNGVSRTDVEHAVALGKVEECLHVIHPKAGDCIFIPAGTVHALGDGLLVAEIQQSSDTTFRFFDWNRVDAEGRSRPLHIEQAIEVTDFERGPFHPSVPQPSEINGLVTLLSCEYFTMQCLSGSSRLEIPNDGRFRIISLPRGSGRITDGEIDFWLQTGETVFLPAERTATTLALREDSQALIVFVP